MNRMLRCPLIERFALLQGSTALTGRQWPFSSFLCWFFRQTHFVNFRSRVRRLVPSLLVAAALHGGIYQDLIFKLLAFASSGQS